MRSGYEHAKGKDVWRNCLQAVSSAAEKTRECLGPNGRYKLVTYNRGPEVVAKITKDASTILEELAFQLPTLTIVSEAAKMQRQEIGDGVATFVILTAELLKKAENLLSKGVHPNVILDGYLAAEKKVLEIIEAQSVQPLGDFRGKILQTVDCERNLLTEPVCGIVIEASDRATKQGKFERERIDVLKKAGGGISESQLVKGVVVEKAKAHPNMPDIKENVRAVVVSGRIGLNRLEVKMRGEGPTHMKLSITEPQQLGEYKTAIERLSNPALDKLELFGVNTIFCQQPIGNLVKSKLTEMDVLAFEGVDQKDCKKIALATKARVVADLADLSKDDIGSAEKIEIEREGLRRLAILTGCECSTLIVRGSTFQGADEMEHAVRNAVTVMQTATQNSKVVPGGGAVEMYIAQELRKFSLSFPGKEQLAVASFADALTEVPFCLAQNNGLPADDIIGELRRFHSKGFSSYGVGEQGCCSNVCLELAQVKSALIKRAYEVVALMLRIDEQVMSKEVPKFHKK